MSLNNIWRKRKMGRTHSGGKNEAVEVCLVMGGEPVVAAQVHAIKGRPVFERHVDRSASFAWCDDLSCLLDG